jgi:hypothetical protein
VVVSASSSGGNTFIKKDGSAVVMHVVSIPEHQEMCKLVPKSIPEL